MVQPGGIHHHTCRACYSQKHLAFPITSYARIKSLYKITVNPGWSKADSLHFDILQEVGLDSSLRYRPSGIPNQYPDLEEFSQNSSLTKSLG